MKYPARLAAALLLLLPTAVHGSLICFLFGTPRCFLGLGAVMRRGTPGDESCEETCAFIFFAIFNFFSGYTCGGCNQLLTGQQNDPNTYHIDVFGVDIPSNDAQAFINAAARWEDVIPSDPHGPFSDDALSNVSPASTLGPGCVYPSEVDDMFICADIRSIDGAGDSNGNILGAAGPDLFNAGIPVTGFMFFDSFDVNQLQQNGSFEDIILHEMGHVLGIGTAWLTNGLQTSSSACPYTGTNANREYQAITNCNNNVPTEPSSSGQGRGCSHWEEGSCLGNEIMSSFYQPNSRLSRITVGSLQDIGYGVDYNRADNYQPAGNCCRRRGLGERRRKLLSDEATATAVAFGQELLASRPPVDTRDSDFSSANLVDVLMLEDGQIFSVMVTLDGAV